MKPTISAGKYYMMHSYVSPVLIHIIDIYEKTGLFGTTRYCTYREITILGSNGLLLNAKVSEFKNIIREISPEEFTIDTISTL